MAHAKFSPVIGRYVTITVDDPDLGGEYKVFYLEHGEGRPLVCQHTAGCHNHQWRGLLEDEDLTKKYRVIAYDLPRHGKSDPPNDREWWKEEYKLTADFFTKFIVTFCDALELDQPIFMGSSFGGKRRAPARLSVTRTASPASSRSRPPTTRQASFSIGGSTPTPTRRRCARAAYGT